jgi:hypothetical protein
MWCSIDPGLNTAIAIWKGKNLIDKIEFSLKDKGLTIERKLYLMKITLNAKICKYLREIIIVHIESVQLWGGSALSYTAGVRGDLFDLAYLIGMYFEYFQSKDKNVYLTPASAWKGQVSYTALNFRVRKIMNFDLLTNYSDHIINAIGLGLYIQDRF